MPEATLTDVRDLYLHTLAGALTHTLYWGLDLGIPHGPRSKRAFVARQLSRFGMVLVHTRPVSGVTREDGRDWPVFAQTMVGHARLANFRSCIETVVADDVPGDIIETGTWRGGASIYARGVMRAHGVEDRELYVCDSFEGLPAPDPTHSADAGGAWHQVSALAISLEEVRANFERYDLYDERVHLVKGWFKDTLPGLADRTWAVMRLDGDMYGSTWDGLSNLYPNLSPGGFVIIDDYSIPECRAAVDDYRQQHEITAPIEHADWTGVFWRKDQ